MIVASALLFLSLFLFAAAMPVHARLLPTGISRRIRPQPIMLAWALLAASLLAGAMELGTSAALLELLGLVPVFAGAILLGLTYAAAFARSCAAVALASLCGALMMGIWTAFS